MVDTSYNKLLLKLYNDVNKYAKKWKNQQTAQDIVFKPFSNAELELVPNIRYYDDIILEKIKSYNKDIFTYSFQTAKRNIQIHFITTTDNDKDPLQIKHSLKNIYIWLHMIEEFTDIQCSQKLNIYLFQTPLFKLMPEYVGDVISTQHANSAFTFSCSTANNIHIFRKEEWFKVFIHECFHNLGLDFSKIDNGFSDKHISGLFPLQIDFRLYESYCESWALLINSVFCCYNRNPKQNSSNVLENIYSVIHQEREFSLFQCSKILHHFGISYPDLYSINEGASFARLNKYKEDTPILSYFVIKTIIVLHYPEFIQWCISNNENPFKFMTKEDKKTYDKIISFVEFIKTIYQSNIVVNSMKTAETNYTELRKKQNLNDIYNIVNLRMSKNDL